jgi:hypothetical protein
MNSEFFVTLPSNTQFPGNTPSNFKVRLPQKITLDGKWEVALTEIMYPHSWNNVTGKTQQPFEEESSTMNPNSLFLRIHDVLFIHALVEPMHYGSAEDLVNAMKAGLEHAMTFSKDNMIVRAKLHNQHYEDEINKVHLQIQELHDMEKQAITLVQQEILNGDGSKEFEEQKNKKIQMLRKYYAGKYATGQRQVEIHREQLEEWKLKVKQFENRGTLTNDVQFNYDKTHHKVNIKLNTEMVTGLKLSPPLAYMLGYEGQSTLNQPVNKAKYPPDLRAGFYALYVYCNLAENQFVGSYRVPLLRTVHVAGNHGEILEKIFQSPHYVPVVGSEFETIEIDIKDDQNQSVKFGFGKVVVKLHFRKKRAFLL